MLMLAYVHKQGGGGRSGSQRVQLQEGVLEVP